MPFTLQGLFRKSSKWSPWSPSQDVEHALDRREEDGIIQGPLHVCFATTQRSARITGLYMKQDEVPCLEYVCRSAKQ